MARVVILFHVENLVRLMNDEVGDARVFDSVAEAEDAVKGHFLLPHARIVYLDDLLAPGEAPGG